MSFEFYNLHAKYPLLGLGLFLFVQIACTDVYFKGRRGYLFSYIMLRFYQDESWIRGWTPPLLW